MKDVSYPAAVVAGTMLHALFPATRGCAADGLAEFQRDAVVRLRTILDRYRGALLCDSVGLGKTHVAATLCSDVLRRGGAVLVTAPSQLRSLWLRQLHDGRWTWASHAMLSRQAASTRLLRRSFDFIVVDEAHAFRNPATQRYRTLARLTLHSRVLLLTATPVNNSLHDFESLLSLFVGDDAFADIGVTSLRHAVDGALSGRPRELRRIAQQVMVRRTRGAVLHWNAGAEPSPHLRFPSGGATELIGYDLARSCAGRIEDILDAVAALRFATHDCLRDGTAAAELVRISLIKRLESSTTAFAASVARLERRNATFIAAARLGLHFDPRRDAGLVRAVDGALQLSMPSLALPPWPGGLDRERALRLALDDRAALRALLQLARAAADRPDAKIATLRDLLCGPLADERVLVFSEYRDTAAAIGSALQQLAGVAVVHGGEARMGGRRTSRRVVIERFAPVANRARRLPLEDVRVLVATDVLAEGMNLQDARVVISYDLPWNPVRLAQRAGRIDRLGSMHERIRVLAFRPDTGLDRLLGLLRRIRVKLRAIRTVGGDAPAPFVRQDRNRSGRWHAAAREIARCEFILRRPPLDPAARNAVCPWHGTGGAVLCCVRLAGTAILVLVHDDGRTTTDSDAAWDALTTAFLQPAVATTDLAPEHPRTAAAEVIALRVAGTSRTAPPVGNETRQKAARLVRRWLAAQPVAPTPAHFAQADAALEMLRTAGPAGLDIRIRGALRHSDPDLLMRHLLHLRSGRAPPDAEPARSHPEVVASIRLLPVDPS